MIPVQKHMRSSAGFTLVELAIVMIIIGLLIAGVLKGQALIQNARVTSTVKSPLVVSNFTRNEPGDAASGGGGSGADTSAPGGGGGGVLSLHATGINCNARNVSSADACLRGFMGERVQGWSLAQNTGKVVAETLLWHRRQRTT